jgi:serine/threonine-protein kinase
MSDQYYDIETLVRTAQESAQGSSQGIESDATIRPPETIKIPRRNRPLPTLAIARAPQPAGDDAVIDLEISSVLGAGGMAVVRLAKQVPLGREVAVKTIHDSCDGPAPRLRLVEEAVTTGLLEHPAIIPVHMLGQDEQGSPVLVMKRVEGVSWREMIKHAEHPLWAKVTGDRLTWHIGVLMQIANAIHFAHKRRIIHRDIKPGNIMIGEFGEVYLMDWGIAIRLDEAPSMIETEPRLSPETARKVIAGTPGYMAPEMLSGFVENVDERTDIYLLGASLHEVLTGKPRHIGANLQEVFANAAKNGPVAYAESVPWELASIANKAMSSDKSERYASAEEFRLALESFLRHVSSIRLSDEAQARLETLKDALAGTVSGRAPSVAGQPGDESAIYRNFGACRFGFQQALSTFPENRRASSGLQEAIERMMEFELLRGNANAAAAVYTELPIPRPDILDRIEALRRSIEREARELEDLRKIHRDMDVNVHSRTRGWVALLISLPLFIGLGALLRMFAGGERTPTMLVILSAVVALCFVAAGYVARKSLLANKANRMLSYGFLLTILTLLGHRLVAMKLGTSVNDILATDLVFLSQAAALAALSMDRRLIWVTFWFVGSTIIAVGFFTETVVQVFRFAMMGGLLINIFIWWRSEPKNVGS